MTDKESEGLKHYLTIFSMFDTEKELAQWYQENIAKHAGYGKPVFSWSMDDESSYRDENAKLTAIVKELREALEFYANEKVSMFDDSGEIAREALLRAEQIENNN